MNDDSMVKIMETLGLDLNPANKALSAFEARVASVNKQLFELKANALKGARDINSALASQLGQLGGSKMILDQYGQPLKILNDNLASSFVKSTEAAKQHAKSVQEVAKQYNILGSEFQRRTQWFLTGTVFYGTLKAAKETAQTISEVEMGITEIARVMEDETFVFKNYRDELLQLGIDYGQTFDVVQDIALRWAQAGYNVRDSLENTKTSLLALNTAELDAQNATESLIGIMAQWQLTSKDLPLVLDKINKTADDFTVTSQDLVDGLLRSSGAAKIMGLSLEQTIALLTVMREASGRTGREVGNALNSILSYVQRPKSIETLEGLGIQVFADAARTQFRNVMLIFQDIAARWDTLSADIQDGFIKAADDAGLYSEELANAIGLQEEWNDLQQRDISQAAAGVYRRNYFIGMIERLSQAQEVLNNMMDAAGYSMRENERTMDTLQKKYTSLLAAAQELAVALGDAGLIDALKSATDIAKNAADSFADLDDSTRALILTVIELLGALAGIKGVMGLFTTKGLFEVAKVIPGWGKLLAVVTALAGSMALLAYNSNNASAQTIDDALKNVKAKQNEIDQTDKLIKKYEELQGKTANNNEVKAEMLDIQRQLAQLYPDYVDGLDAEGNKLVTNIPLLREMNALKQQELEVERQKIIMSARTRLPQLQAEQKRLQEQIKANNERLASGDTTRTLRKGRDTAVIDISSQLRKENIELLERLAAVQLEEQSIRSILGTVDEPYEPRVLNTLEWNRLKQSISTGSSSDSSSGAGTGTGSGSGDKTAPYKNEALQNALRLLQHKKHMNQITLEEEIAYLKEIRDKHVKTAEERMDIEERIYSAEQALIKENEQAQEKYLDKVRWLREREAQDYKDTLKELQDDIKEAYDERIDAIEKEADAKKKAQEDIIKGIEEELKLLDREESAYDYEQKIADLREQEAYWSVRTGENARKQLAEVRKKIAEAEHDREIELKKQELEDKKEAAENEIDAIEEAAEKEKEKWKAAYKQMEKAFEDHNLDIVAQAAAYSKEAYQQWVDNYLVPMKKALESGDIEGFSGIAGKAPTHDYGMSNRDYEKFIANGVAWYSASPEQRKILQAENDALRAKYGIPAGEYPKFHSGGMSLSSGWAQVLPGEIFFPPDFSKDLKTLIAVASGITGKVSSSSTTYDHRKEINLNGPLLNVEHMHMEDDIDGEILARQLNRAVISLP